jgi:hypothetical protein
MSVREVLRDQWVEFFQTFTSEHAGKLVSLGVDGRQPKHEIVDIKARELPLRGIVAVLTDDESTIVISLGLSSDRVLRHSVLSVSHIRVTQTEDSFESALEIESRNGQTTTLNISTEVKRNG